MSLVSEAGSTRSSAGRAASVWPLVRSPTTQERPMIDGGCGATACAHAQTKKRTTAKRCMKKLRIIGRLACDEQRFEVELGFDALGDRPRLLARPVWTDLQ